MEIAVGAAYLRAFEMVAGPLAVQAGEEAAKGRLKPWRVKQFVGLHLGEL
jgi:hypothetical protein